MIKKEYQNKYVWIDPYEIYNYITNNWNKTIENINAIVAISTANLLHRGISDKKNYVIEITFTKPEILNYIKDYMVKIWYKVSILAVMESLEKSLENNMNRSETNMSSYYTEDVIYATFKKFFENTYNKLAREEWLKEI